jgi:hypothetical protein
MERPLATIHFSEAGAVTEAADELPQWGKQTDTTTVLCSNAIWEISSIYQSGSNLIRSID